jgi:hypothetical protein
MLYFGYMPIAQHILALCMLNHVVFWLYACYTMQYCGCKSAVPGILTVCLLHHAVFWLYACYTTQYFDCIPIKTCRIFWWIYTHYITTKKTTICYYNASDDPARLESRQYCILCRMCVLPRMQKVATVFPPVLLGLGKTKHKAAAVNGSILQ